MNHLNVRELADAADVIVDGFAFSRDESGFRVVNLATGNVAACCGEKKNAIIAAKSN